MMEIPYGRHKSLKTNGQTGAFQLWEGNKPAESVFQPVLASRPLLRSLTSARRQTP